MNKIKIQLEQVIEKRLTYLVSNNFEFTVEGKTTEISKIIGVSLYMQKDFDEELRDGEINFVEPKGRFVTARIICSNCEVAHDSKV